MTTETPGAEKSILQLLHELGIEKAHFAGRVPRDWQPILRVYPESVASLTLLCPRATDAPILNGIGSRLLVITGDQGDHSEKAMQGMGNLPEATSVVLPDYLPDNATDVVAERTETVGDALLGFLSQRERSEDVPPVSPKQGDGQLDGLLYHVQGVGPPLVLLPLQYSPTQWDHLLGRLSQSYCTITLSGARVGAVSNLEARALGGYLKAVNRVVDEIELKPGERFLDIGCGPGSLDRWLAHHTAKANPITGVDPSTLLLREAAAMVKSEGLEGIVQFQEGSGDSLPFPDRSFDVAMSFTAMQYVDADQMIKEMMRVTKPGGRVAVLARGDDRPNLINVSVRTAVRSKIEGVRTQRQNQLGCNDSSLYLRFQQAGLTGVKMFPQLAIFTPASDGARLNNMQDQFGPVLNSEELEEFRDAYRQALADGSFFLAEWFHCAVGTNSG